jgi:methionine aminopeptidase
MLSATFDKTDTLKQLIFKFIKTKQNTQQFNGYKNFSEIFSSSINTIIWKYIDSIKAGHITSETA